MNALDIIAHSIWKRYSRWKTWDVKLDTYMDWCLQITMVHISKSRGRIIIDFMPGRDGFALVKVNSTVWDWTPLGEVELADPDFIDKVHALVMAGRKQLRL